MEKTMKLSKSQNVLVYSTFWKHWVRGKPKINWLFKSFVVVPIAHYAFYHVIMANVWDKKHYVHKKYDNSMSSLESHLCSLISGRT